MNDTSLSLIKQFSDDLICFICKKKSCVPKIMPCCGKIGCEKCIQDTISQKTECPNCKSNLNQHLEPVHLHLIDSIEGYLPFLELLYSDTEICQKHANKIEYFCVNCNMPLCSGCLYDELFSGSQSHKNHNIIEIKMKLQKDLALFSKAFDSIEATSASLLKVESKLEKSKNAFLLELHSVFKEMLHSIESKKAITVKPLIDRIDQLEQLKDQISESLHLINRLIANQSRAILIESPKILDKAQNLQKNYQQMEQLKPELNIDNDISPQYQFFQIQIPNFVETQKRFAELSAKDDKFILYDKKTINGNKWRAKIYPNGNKDAEGLFLSVFIELIRGNKTPSNYFYRVEIISNDPSKSNIVKEYNSKFKNDDTWGWNKVASLDTILNKSGYIDSKGSLAINIGIRAETYYQIYKDLQEAVRYENMKIKKLKKKSGK